MTTPADDLARVTVISPTRHLDLALPGAATVAELLPSIVRFSGIEDGSAKQEVRDWVLQRLGQDPLDPHRPVAELQLRDGETLHLRRRKTALPQAAFDDVVDAVATSLSAQPAWQPPDSRRFALIVVAIVAIAVPAYALIVSPSIWSALGVLGYPWPPGSSRSWSRERSASTRSRPSWPG